MSPERAAVLDELASALAAMTVGHPLRVGIDGVDAAGKTTLADELAPLVEARGRPVIRASVDDFHRPRDERYRRGELSPDGFYLDTFDYDAVRRCCSFPSDPAVTAACMHARGITYATRLSSRGCFPCPTTPSCCATASSCIAKNCATSGT